ncbi:MAG: DUF4876 domain-containing protein [Bacteroidales bacterium]|nr:DUF4876 domain-containing protein [Bacteroidales bacterium]
MKKQILFLMIAMAALAFTSCKKDNVNFVFPTGNIRIILPENANITARNNQTVKFTNRTTNEVKTVSYGDEVELTKGLYDCDYTAEVEYIVDGVTCNAMLSGSVSSVNIIDETGFPITTYLMVSCNDFIIEEIFFTGTLRPSGTTYNGDSYIKLYNNTDKVLYADGVAILESEFTSTTKYDYSPDIQATTMTVEAIYVIPGSGTEHPVQPGESIVICDVGIDHRDANPNSFDLSHADFEWYDESTSPQNLDIDGATVPNMDKWYCYTASYWILHNRGFRSYAIARIPIAKEVYLQSYSYTYNYTMHLAAGDFDMQRTAYQIPNEWIIDGVNCSVEAERKWNILPPNIDAGWTHCGTFDHDQTRYFKSVRRKMLSLTSDRRRVLKDTNNSTDDFNTECVPSLIEQQGTATDANGTPANGVTYDGVTPMNN